jgi:hypothetical protein
MRIIKILLVSALCSSLGMQAQTPPLNLSPSPSPVPGEYRQNFIQGNQLMEEKNWPMALKFFREAYRKDSTSANINFKMGLCLLNSNTDKAKALIYLRRAVKDLTRNYDQYDYQQTKAPEICYLYLGQAYHLNNDFDSAEINLQRCKQIIGTKNEEISREVENSLQWCKQARLLTASPLPIRIINLGDSVNTAAPEYSPILSLDENTIYFTSRRYGERDIEDNFYEDILVADRKRDSSWSNPLTIPSIQSTTNNEATIFLSADGQTLFIYKGDNGGDIYACTSNGKEWSQPVVLGSDINSKYWEPHACMTADGQTLYFVSDRPGGYGGRDIYRCVKLPNGKWSKALNLGSSVNTPFDEDAPFIHPDQTTLFFASKGHTSMGGFDIFFTTQTDETKWATPINMGYPINTSDDDVFFVTSPDGRRGYFSSIRPEGRGDKDIYMVTLQQSSTQPLTLLRGRIYNIDGSPLTQDIEIDVTNTKTSESGGVYRPNMRNGSFAVILLPGATYLISYMVDGKEYTNEIIDVPMGSEFEIIDRAIDLRDLVLGRLRPDLPVDTAKVAPYVPEVPGDTSSLVSSSSQTRPKRQVPDVKGQLSTTNGLNYEMFFKYNISQIDPTDEDFKKFIDTCVAHINKYGSIRFRITASASQVPTRTFKDNKELSKDRAERAQKTINDALVARGVDLNKVKWQKVKSYILGPTYKSDYVENREIYERYQYVKVRGF